MIFVSLEHHRVERTEFYSGFGVGWSLGIREPLAVTVKL